MEASARTGLYFLLLYLFTYILQGFCETDIRLDKRNFDIKYFRDFLFSVPLF